MMSCDYPGSGGMDAVYVATNAAHYASWFDLPNLPEGYRWQLSFNTGDAQNSHLEPPADYDNHGILVGDRSMVIFAASPVKA
jgi:hypothetical protein